MSIQNPIIAAGPSIQKVDTGVTRCPLIEVTTPPPWTIVNLENGLLQVKSYPPQWAGQMIFTKNPDLYTVNIYIVVDIDGELVWKPVKPIGVTTDPRTGKPKDPLYDLY